MATALVLALRFADARDADEVARAAAAVVDAAPSAARADGGWSWSCWRLLGREEVRTEVALASTAAPDGLRVALEDGGPLCALAGPDGRPYDHPHHARVAENVEAWLALVFALAAELRPRAFALHTDAGVEAPWNAHLAGFADEAAAAAELERLRALARTGDETLGLPPIATADPTEGPALHRWRSPDDRARLRADLETLAAGPPATPARVRAALDSGTFDVWQLEHGFAVGEHPWVLNAFVDRFWRVVGGG